MKQEILEDFKDSDYTKAYLEIEKMNKVKKIKFYGLAIFYLILIVTSIIFVK